MAPAISQTVQAAVNAAPDEPQGSKPFLIHIKPGTYTESVTVPVQKGALDFQGDDAAATTITYANAAATLDAGGKPLGTFKSATAFIQADGFSASNITFANSFGKGSQALAISVSGDRAAFRKCRFLGWQDTILLLQGRQYFEDCGVTGAVDFIFGAATAFFQRCDIHCLSGGYITAASTPQDHPFGFVFANCNITAEPGVKTYLGRPWRPCASVTFLNTQMSDAVRPKAGTIGTIRTTRGPRAMPSGAAKAPAGHPPHACRGRSSSPMRRRGRSPLSKSLVAGIQPPRPRQINNRRAGRRSIFAAHGGGLTSPLRNTDISVPRPPFALLAP
jgi:pectin methylesterase-like acyl-CoA thioesterase